MTLPHDWSIALPPTNATGPNACPTCSACTGYRPGGFAWYRKVFTLPMAGAAGNPADEYSVDFNGSFGFTTVYLNGAQVGTKELSGYTHDYGFTGFRVEPAGRHRPGPAERERSERDRRERLQYARRAFYKGSGLYGDVSFLETKPVHIARYGVFVTTPNLAITDKAASPYGNAQVQTQVINQGTSSTRSRSATRSSTPRGSRSPARSPPCR